MSAKLLREGRKRIREAMAKRDPITKLLDDINTILIRDGKTCADIARDIGKDYHRVYLWVSSRKFKPRAEGLILLQEWRDRHLGRSHLGMADKIRSKMA